MLNKSTVIKHILISCIVLYSATTYAHRSLGIGPMFNLNANYPQGAALELGIAAATGDGDTFMFISGEPGQNGFKRNIGFNIRYNERYIRFFLTDLSMDNNVGEYVSGGNYKGVQVQFLIFKKAQLKFGIFSGDEKSNLASFGVGIGL